MHVTWNYDLPGLRAGTETRGQLHRGTEQILVLRHRLAGTQPNPQMHRTVGILLIMRIERPQDGDGAFDRIAHRGEAGHEAVAVCLTSRPPLAFKRPRTMALCVRNSSIAPASPNSWFMAVEPCRSVNKIARKAVSSSPGRSGAIFISEGRSNAFTVA